MSLQEILATLFGYNQPVLIPVPVENERKES